MKIHKEPEEIIDEVKKQPALWQPGSTNAARKIAWRHVLTRLVEDFNTKSPEIQAELENVLKSRWSSIRDCHRREARLRVEEEDSPSSRKRYRYFDRLQFLDEAAPAPMKKRKTATPPEVPFLKALAEVLQKIPESKRGEVEAAIMNIATSAVPPPPNEEPATLPPPPNEGPATHVEDPAPQFGAPAPQCGAPKTYVEEPTHQYGDHPTPAGDWVSQFCNELLTDPTFPSDVLTSVPEGVDGGLGELCEIPSGFNLQEVLDGLDDGEAYLREYCS